MTICFCETLSSGSGREIRLLEAARWSAAAFRRFHSHLAMLLNRNSFDYDFPSNDRLRRDPSHRRLVDRAEILI